MNIFLNRAKELNNEILENRRKLHSVAETGFDLPVTTKYVTDKLTEYGIDYNVICESAIVATIGKKSGKTILLRADMDALPMEEKSNLPFAAINGNCHSCGHDCHTSMLLGAAKMLKENENLLEGTVKLMFQPAEEKLAGAVAMINAGVLENPKVDAALALHIAVGQDDTNSGTILYTPGTALYSGDAVTITVKGKDAHGSTPYLGVDAINIAAHIVIALQEIISREIPSSDKAVIIIGKIQGGNTCNTLAGTAVLEASVRALTPESRDFLKQRIKEVSESVAATFRGEAIVDFVYGMPPLVNDIHITNLMSKYCEDIIPAKDIIETPLKSGTEDFTSIAQLVPSTYLMLGVGSICEGYTYSAHNPFMTINEDVLYLGSAIYANCAYKYLIEN